MNKNAKVYLVGAGPGDPGLLTLKAASIIKVCDVLIYDNLVNQSILELTSDDCEKIYAGKKANEHTLKQEEINDLLVEKAQSANIIVRLKGGDPIVFGRGAEEAEYLLKHQVPFEIIPGITSALSAPIYAGIPVSHRDYNSAFMVLTGHEDPEKEVSFLDWQNIANFKGTLIVLMGVKNLKAITDKLIILGRNPDEPSALIYQGTTPEQKTLTAKLSTIADLSLKHAMHPPCIFISGKVVTLREKINWFETLPLFGKNIAITRSKDQNQSLRSSLTALGASVIELSSIKISTPDNFDSVDSAIKNINLYDWLIFTSVNGVTHFCHRLFDTGFDARYLSKIKIAAIGSITAKELLKYGLKADFIPEKFLSKEIVSGLNQINEIKNKKFLLARSNISRIEFADALINSGAQVEDLVVYKTEIDETTQQNINKILDIEKLDLITFTSPSTVENLLKMLTPKRFKDILKETIIASIGPVTSSTLKDLLGRVDIEASTHDIDGLLSAIIDYYT